MSNNLEISGKIVKIMNEVNGESSRGKWAKQEFVIETLDSFPKKVCMSAWGEKILQIKDLKPGDEITVAFNVESREFNDRWYTDLRAWKISAGNKAASSGGNNNNNSGASEPGFDISATDNSDDLPF